MVTWLMVNCKKTMKYTFYVSHDLAACKENIPQQKDGAPPSPNDACWYHFNQIIWHTENISWNWTIKKKWNTWMKHYYISKYLHALNHQLITHQFIVISITEIIYFFLDIHIQNNIQFDQFLQWSLHLEHNGFHKYSMMALL